MKQRRFLSVLAVLAMTAVIIGCGNNGEKEEKKPGDGTPVSSITLTHGSGNSAILGTVELDGAGEEEVFTAAINPAEAANVAGFTVTWISSAPGNITITQDPSNKLRATAKAVAIGTARITVTAKNNDNDQTRDPPSVSFNMEVVDPTAERPVTTLGATVNGTALVFDNTGSARHEVDFANIATPLVIKAVPNRTNVENTFVWEDDNGDELVNGVYGTTGIDLDIDDDTLTVTGSEGGRTINIHVTASNDMNGGTNPAQVRIITIFFRRDPAAAAPIEDIFIRATWDSEHGDIEDGDSFKIRRNKAVTLTFMTDEDLMDSAGLEITWDADEDFGENVTINVAADKKSATVTGSAYGGYLDITVTAENNDNDSPAEMTFTIKVDNPVMAITILDQDSVPFGDPDNTYTLSQGKQYDLTVSYDPPDAEGVTVDWNATNPNAAWALAVDSVGSGLTATVLGLATNTERTITITASSPDNEESGEPPVVVTFAVKVESPAAVRGTRPDTWINTDSDSVAVFGSANGIQTVSWGNGVFVAVGGTAAAGNGGHIMWSEDGIEWTKVDDADIHNSLPSDQTGGAGTFRVTRFADFGGGKFVAGGAGYVYYSTDGKVWETADPDGDSSYGPVHSGATLCIKYVEIGGEGYYLSAGTANGVAYCPVDEMDNWTFAAFPDNLTIDSSVPDGRTFSTVRGITSGNGKVILVGDASATLNTYAVAETSLDEWVVYPSGDIDSTDGFQKAGYGDGLFIAGGNSGRIEVSTDGKIWKAAPVIAPASGTVNNFAYGDGYFVLATGTSRVNVMADGVFTSPSASVGSTYFGVAYSPELKIWVAGGAAGNTIYCKVE